MQEPNVTLLSFAHRPAWLRVDRLLGEHGLREDNPQTRAELLTRIESRRAQDDEPSLRPIRRGWCLGSPAFQQQMLDLIGAQSKEPPSQLRVENSSLRAQRIVAEELHRLSWTTEPLSARRRNAPNSPSPPAFAMNHPHRQRNYPAPPSRHRELRQNRPAPPSPQPGPQHANQFTRSDGVCRNMKTVTPYGLITIKRD